MKWNKGIVVGQTKWAPGLFSLFIDVSPIEFKAGQFVQICLHEDQKLFRPYSLLNAPDDPIVEIYFTLVREGHLTSRLAARSLNDIIWVSEKAHGRFILNEIEDSSILWCFATGTGLGPFISMLKTKTPWERFSKIVLVHSVRYANELTHQLLIETWQEMHSTQFHWCPIITREQSEHAFNARIPTLLENGQLEKALDLPLLVINSQVMLCGNPAMVEQVTQSLTQRGLKVNHPIDKGQITFENYWKKI